MKNLLIMALMVGLLGIGGTAHASSWDNLDWWANSEATPQPVKDGYRGGHWWWPIQPVSNTEDGEAWGNRGVVYGMFTPALSEMPPPAPPAPTPAPVVGRETPVLNSVLFDFDKSDLKPSGDAVVGQAVASLKSNPNDTLVVEGHTCDLNRSGDPQYNQKLGQRRANTVRDAIVAAGISGSRVTAISKGENDPAVANSSDANRAKNRRAVFVYSIGD